MGKYPPKVLEVDTCLDQFQYDLVRSDPEKVALKYLKSRSVTSKQVLKYKIGYSRYEYSIPPFPKTIFFNRLIFPVRNEYGQLEAFTTRKPHDEETPGSRYSKVYLPDKNPIYGLYEALPDIYASGCAVLVEGNLDVTAVEPYFPAVIASSTGRLTSKQMRLLQRFVKRLFVFPDLDETGEKMEAQVRKFYSRWFQVNFIKDSPVKDANAWRSQNPEEFAEYFKELWLFYGS